MPITCSVRCQKRLTYLKEVDVPMYKLKWSDDKRDTFLQNLYLAENLSEIDRAESLIVINVNEAISVLTAALNKVASCLVKKQSGKTVFFNEWYDKECKHMRRLTGNALRTFFYVHVWVVTESLTVKHANNTNIYFWLKKKNINWNAGKS